MTDNWYEKFLARGDEFHMVMGYCIAAWATVDEQLFLLFSDCVAPREQAAIIYYRTPGLDVRLSLTDEIVKSALLPSGTKPGTNDSRIKAWKRLTKAFRDLLPVRRRIAHHPVGNDAFRAGAPVGLALSNFEIYVNQHERVRDNAARLTPLRIEDLRKHHEAVKTLATGLYHFYRDVLSVRERSSLPLLIQPT